MPKLLLATHNKAKIEEYHLLLERIPYQLTTLAKKSITRVVAEDGTTYEENATLKATIYAKSSGLLTLADDSGLEVEALGGEPGPRAARYAGEGASDKDRIDYLLAKLAGIPWERRGALFRCVIAIATPEGKLELCQGQCEGIIALEPQGSYGFGYDPIFYLPTLDKTMAQLPLAIKNQYSHRARAAEKASVILKRLSRVTVK
ncbi:MAG: RdgB/HAM1 family non-canonical purine NTP pyrophosphatase [Chloroflexi bacterium]|nr:RdgB/HAM1 family non-canonical purine NTP pyrophosphatase [Chloroflexota bacterium]